MSSERTPHLFYTLFFGYIAGIGKLLKEYYQDVPGANLDELFDTVEEAEEFIKKQFQKLFREKADDLFTTLGEDKFRSLFGTDDIDVFKSLVAEGQPITFDFFNFVKVK